MSNILAHLLGIPLAFPFWIFETRYLGLYFRFQSHPASRRFRGAMLHFEILTYWKSKLQEGFLKTISYNFNMHRNKKTKPITRCGSWNPRVWGALSWTVLNSGTVSSQLQLFESETQQRKVFKDNFVYCTVVGIKRRQNKVQNQSQGEGCARWNLRVWGASILNATRAANWLKAESIC